MNALVILLFFFLGVLIGFAIYDLLIKYHLKTLEQPVVVEYALKDFFLSSYDLPGSFADGKTFISALKDLEESVNLWLETARERGMEVSRPYAYPLFIPYKLKMKSLEKGLVDKELVRVITDFIEKR